MITQPEFVLAVRAVIAAKDFADQHGMEVRVDGVITIHQKKDGICVYKADSPQELLAWLDGYVHAEQKRTKKASPANAK